MEGTGLDYCVAAVWRANGLIQQRRIDEGLSLLEQLARASRDPWTANVVAGATRLRNARSLVAGASSRSGADDAWDAAEQEAERALGDVHLRTITRLAVVQDPWPDLVNEFLNQLEDERRGVA